MTRIFGACRTCFLILGPLFAIIVFFAVFAWLVKKHPKVFWTILITSMFVSVFTLATNKYIFPKFYRIFSSMFGGSAREYWIRYDTDPRNDTFIKGRLEYRRLLLLDRVLLKEKELCGNKLDSQTLNEIARYDNKILDAYDRWRKCKDMRRSHHKSIYPDERAIYHYLRD